MQYADIDITAKNLKECYQREGVAPFYTFGLWQDIFDNKINKKATGDLEEDTAVVVKDVPAYIYLSKQ